jgi:hypothetical protein
MSSASDLSTDIFGKGSNIGSFRTRDKESDLREVNGFDLEVKDVDLFFGPLDLESLSGHSVKRFSFDLNGREHGRNLTNASGKRPENEWKTLRGDLFPRPSRNNLSCKIVGCGLFS